MSTDSFSSVPLANTLVLGHSATSFPVQEGMFFFILLAFSFDPLASLY